MHDQIVYAPVLLSDTAVYSKKIRNVGLGVDRLRSGRGPEKLPTMAKDLIETFGGWGVDGL